MFWRTYPLLIFIKHSGGYASEDKKRAVRQVGYLQEGLTDVSQEKKLYGWMKQRRIVFVTGFFEYIGS